MTLVLSRRALVDGPPAGVDDEHWADAATIVAEHRARVTLDIESVAGGRRIDCWIGATAAAWHAEGDDDTARRVIVHPVPLLPSTIAAFTGLGARAPGDARSAIELPLLTAAVRSGDPTPAGRLLRSWTLEWAVGERVDGMSVLDCGPGERLWAVAGRHDDAIDLRQISAYDVWVKLGELLAVLHVTG
jgi:hypothetical protein